MQQTTGVTYRSLKQLWGWRDRDSPDAIIYRHVVLHDNLVRSLLTASSGHLWSDNFMRVAQRGIFLMLAIVPLVSGVTQGEDQFFNSDGVRIRYTDEGHGPPVVLIHGFAANGDMNWRLPGVVDMLAKNYRVITLDNRGHGKSDKPSEVDDYGVKMVYDVLHLLDHLKIDKAHFVGYSMGGMITMKLTAIAPQRMLSAVVGGMGWIPLGSAVEERKSGGLLGPSLRACAQAFPQLGITKDELLAIRVPMVIVIGADDGLLARRVNPLREARPDIPVVEIAGASHLTCVFRPEFRKAIQEFLDKQVTPVH